MDLRTRRALGSGILLTTVWLGAVAAHASETCVQTRVTETFVSPDGREHGSGLVKVCPYWSITPSLRLSAISFNGVKLGVWMTRAGEAGKFADAAKIALRHLPEGRIALANYYWPGRDGLPEAPGLRTANGENAAVAGAPLGP